MSDPQKLSDCFVFLFQKKKKKMQALVLSKDRMDVLPATCFAQRVDEVQTANCLSSVPLRLS